MKQTNRINSGLIDRTQTFSFTFNGKKMQGHPGDTLASALLGNGQKLVGRSFKYHRPRGIFSAGSEEPNALVQLRSGAHQEPNTRATVAELYEGLTATSQNHRGSLEKDLMAITDWLAPFLGAGFYYKTFMWPRAFWEKLYEPAIRASAGLGRLSLQEDPDVYDHGYLHCDVLIIGAGPAGLAAALAAGRSGARVIIADEDFLPGGRLNAERHEVNGQSGNDWAAAVWAELDSMPNVRCMTRTMVFGAYDHGIYGALERKTDHLAASHGKPRQIMWRIYSKRAILCAGATERSIAFGNNDRPGIMLAGSVRAYVNRWGVAPGQKIAILTNNDSGWDVASDLMHAGANVTALIDTRTGINRSADGIRTIQNAAVINTRGRRALGQITLTDGQVIDADCLAVSGGWSPNVHLTCHHRGRPIWDDTIAGFVPGSDLPPGMVVAGAANGAMTLNTALLQGHQAALATLSELAMRFEPPLPPKGRDESYTIKPFWQVNGGPKRAWVDLQNDVTTKDIVQSKKEGFRSVELLKRYTTMGMATDQGKTANVLGLAILAEAAGKTIPETGTTIFRPPYAPVSIGAFAGRARGKGFRPTRLTFSHEWAAENGADFVETGPWLRAQWYKRGGEKGWRDSVDREVRMTRQSVGICDVTTLGKIDIQGKDAAEFLNRVYANGFAKLPVGRVRYGLMLREDGFVYDDGTTARLSDTHFVMTTTTANAVLVFRNMEFARQCLWPDLDVHLISVTDAWSQYAVAGPNARALMSKVVDDLDLSNEAFPFMACTECTVFGGTPARLFRISFSGELAYEIAVPSRYGDAMIRALMQAGQEFDAVPYGTEALGVMRIEKGHAAGSELNGQTTAQMLGMGAMVSKKKDSIGSRLSERANLNRDDDLRMVGFHPVDKSHDLKAGAHFLNIGDPADMHHDQGWMTSVAWSPELGHSVGLGFLKNGPDRIGQTIRAYNPVRDQDIEVVVTSAHHIDPAGDRQRG